MQHRKRVPITPEILAVAIPLYRDEGQSTYQIARQYGLMPETLRAALVKAGVQMRHGKVAQRQNRRAAA